MADIGYVDLAYADTYIAEHFLSANELRVKWEALQEADKEVLLRRSFEAIEGLPFTGHKTDFSQPNAFPRWPEKEIPEAIMAAQVENAVALADSSASVVS